MNNRNGTADLLKGIAVLFMVQVHLTEVFALPELYNSFIGHISLFLGGPPAAPVFMAVMGFYIYKSRKSFSEQFTKGFLIFAGGIFLNIGLNAHLLYDIFSGNKELDPYKFILGADILALAGLSIIILSGVKRIFNYKPIPYLLLGVIVIVLTPIINNSLFIHPYIQAFLGGKIGWSYFPLFPWLIYPLAGFLFGIYYEKIIMVSKKIQNAAVIILFSAVAVTFIYIFPVTYNLELYYHHEFLFVIWTLGFLLVFTWFINLVDIKTGNLPFMKYIKWIGQNVTSFYVVQWLLIGNLGTEIYQTQNNMQLLILFIVVVTSSCIIVYLYKKFNPVLSSSPIPEVGSR